MLFAGILAGMWPFGIVTLLSELFLSESKTQVYGALHGFFKEAPNAATKTSKISSTSGAACQHYAILCICRVYLL